MVGRERYVNTYIFGSKEQALKLVVYFWLTFDENIQGQWRGFAPIPDISLEQLADDLEGENKEGYLEFLQRILRWLPEERPRAEELVFDPWLMEGLNFKKATT